MAADALHARKGSRKRPRANAKYQGKPVSSRRSSLTENGSSSFAREDDTCAIAYIQDEPIRFLGCIPKSLASFFKDLHTLNEMPGDTTQRKLYNALTINDRVTYITAALVLSIVFLLVIKRLASSPHPRQLQPNNHFYYPPQN